MGSHGDLLTFGASFQWPNKDLQFLVLSTLFSALEVSTWSGFTNSSNSAHGFTVHKLMDVVVVQVLVCS